MPAHRAGDDMGKIQFRMRDHPLGETLRLALSALGKSVVIGAAERGLRVTNENDASARGGHQSTT
jgi:hypothetical protein